MRAPRRAGDFVAEVAERIGFPVGFRAECGPDSGSQVGRYQAFPDEYGMQTGDFGDQVCEVIDQAGDGFLALVAGSHSREFNRDCAEGSFKVDL
jgi:hypothetical protein